MVLSIVVHIESSQRGILNVKKVDRGNGSKEGIGNINVPLQ